MYIAGENGIETGDTYFTEIEKIPVSGRRNSNLERKRGHVRNMDIYDKISINARIDHSRWIVDCPSCNNAEFMFEDKTLVVGKEDCLFVPAKKKHTARVVDGPVKALEIYVSAEDTYYKT